MPFRVVIDAILLNSLFNSVNIIIAGADVNRQTSTNDHTVLSLACAGGHLAVVELLLAQGADPAHKLKVNSHFCLVQIQISLSRDTSNYFQYTVNDVTYKFRGMQHTSVCQ